MPEKAVQNGAICDSIGLMEADPAALPDDVTVLKAALIAARARADAAQAEAAVARAKPSDAEALIAHLKLEIAKLNRERLRPALRAHRRLLDQLELQLEELEASATEDELAAEREVPRHDRGGVHAASGRPEAIPRASAARAGDRARVRACPCCGGSRLSKLGEDVTETLEVIPRHWKVIQHVREKFTCRDCETISQAPAPFHVIRAAGPVRACWR